jgi:3',5'-cyclic AMP phosphodiesterase CpdA
MSIDRRSFLNHSALVTAATSLPARWCRAKDLPVDRKLKMRFAVASDLHYGQVNTPFEQMAEKMVGWMNKEKQGKGLDLLFINGDLTHDQTQMLLELRDKHLSKLEMPYYCTKGNHDYLDPEEKSPTESWKKIWGYDANHTVTHKDFAFVLADTSAPAKSNVYRAASREWLKAEFKKYAKAPAIFSLIHIQQRKHKVYGWPRHGVNDVNQAEEGEAVMSLLETTPNVRGVFHGHNHDQTNMWISGDRRYFFDSHVGGSWGAAKGYRIVEIDELNRMVTYQVNAESGEELNRNDLP